MLRVDLSVDYPGKPDVVRNVSFEIARGEVLGLVGQSGSGKSTIALSILRLLQYRGGTVRGSIRFDGVDLMGLSASQLRALRGRELAYVPQSPATSLNQSMRVRSIIGETWRAHNSRAISEEAMLDLLTRASLPATTEFLNLRARQLSIGQGQRLLIALAILHGPKLIVADEPTSALDLITQQEILALFRWISGSTGAAILYISHDLTSVLQLCDRVAILHEGSIVESGETRRVFENPQGEYSKKLIGAIPRMQWADGPRGPDE